MKPAIIRISLRRCGQSMTEITISDLEDVLEVRLALEELAVQNVCRWVTEEHAEILEALEEGDEQKALEATSRHIARQKEHIIAELSKKAPQ